MGKNVLLGVTGSIAAYKACEIVGKLRKRGYSVRCMMSKDAGQFITPLSLEVLSGKKTVSDMFSRPDKLDPAHISLTDEADMILIAPASADIIGKIASGICDDIVTCSVSAAGCPVMIAPAMNDRMYSNPIIRDKMDYLRAKGFVFIEPVKGRLACGREGMGHLALTDTIVETVHRELSSK